jgi:hypothetical protein
MPNHAYTTRILWTGNRGEGTAHYKAYDRTWDIAVPGKAIVHCSNDPLRLGNRENDPERLCAEYPLGVTAGEEMAAWGVTGQAGSPCLSSVRGMRKAVHDKGGSRHGRGARDRAGHCA